MTLFLVGGGPTDRIGVSLDDFCARARTLGGPVAIMLLGSEEEAGQYLADYVEPLRERLPETELRPVWLVGDDTAWPESFEQLGGLVVAGGWTPGYLDALAPKAKQIRQAVRRGVPYLGYSAGAMVIAKHAYVGGWRLGERALVQPEWGEGLDQLDVRDGLGIIGQLVETHADAARTEGLVITALEQHLARSAVSIDEHTCLVLEPSTGEVRVDGAGWVRFFERSHGEVFVQTMRGAG